MNILPKKRWHVRTRDNIARVRRDEAAAAEEEKKKDERIKLAEKEARRELLREQAREKYGFVPKKEEKSSTERQEVPLIDSHGHVNLFYELEQSEVVSNKKNVDHEKEAKEEREKEEMKIGYLTYLGQDTNELTGNVSWYNKAPQKSQTEDAEIGLREKLLADPLKDIRQYLQSDGVKKVTESIDFRHQSSSSSKEKDYTEKRKKKMKKKIKKLARKLKKKKEEKRKKKRKRVKSSSSASEEDKEAEEKKERELERLRTERLQREQVEKQRAAELLARVRGEPPEYKEKKSTEEPHVKQKYNSQFNPFLARQNYE